jgi:hypothetical protein
LLAYIEHGLQLLWVGLHEGQVINVEKATYPYWCGGAMRNSDVGETRAKLENQVCHIDPKEARREFGALVEAAQDFDTIMCRQMWVEHPKIYRSEAFAKMYSTSDSQCHDQRADKGVCAGIRMGMPWCSQ